MNLLVRSLKSYFPLLKIYLILILLGLISRSVLLVLYTDHFSEMTIGTLLYGIRMDTIVFSGLMILLIPLYVTNLITLFRLMIAGIVFYYLFLEISTLIFFDKFHSRPNYIFFEYLANPKEVFGTLWGMYKYTLISVFLILTGIGSYVFIKSKDYFSREKTKYKIIALPIVLILLFLGMRSSLDSSTPNPSFYTFSNSCEHNEIANCTFFSLGYGLYANSKDQKVNFPIEADRAFEVTQKAMKEKFVSKTSLKRELKSNFSKKQNVILIILESFGNNYVGYLEGTPTTPNLDNMKNDGLYFTHLYGVGPRTHWGISSTLTSLNPHPNTSYLKLLKSQHDFYTIAKSFKKYGYKNYFFYGGDSSFDNMSGFVLSNGYDEVIDKFNFDPKLTKRTWGYSDEDLYDQIYSKIKAQTKPYFITAMTLSSHEPYDYPKDKIQLYKKEPAEGFANSIKYADYALGKFYRKLQKEGLLKNTVVAFVADHGAEVHSSFDGFERNRLAAMILSQSLDPQKYDKIASQVDFGITLLDVAGISDSINVSGQSVLQKQRNTALMVLGENTIFLTGKKYVVYRKKNTPICFNYKHLEIDHCEKEIEAGYAQLKSANMIYNEHRGK